MVRHDNSGSPSMCQFSRVSEQRLRIYDEEDSMIDEKEKRRAVVRERLTEVECFCVAKVLGDIADELEQVHRHSQATATHLLPRM
jgi:hypothetical protein